jgi:hypothetical protein
MPKSMKLQILLVGLFFALSGVPALAEPPADAAPAKKATGKFIRLKRDAGEEPAALETAVVRYVPADGKAGFTVDLISVVHIGDRKYYEKLNKLFDDYDVVLYELVAPPGTRVPKGGKRSDNPLALLQRVMKLVLGLDSQVECVDYTRKNFVHADLSFDSMAEALHRRGENGFTLALNMIADMMKQQNVQDQQGKKPGAKKGADLDLLSLLSEEDAGSALKKALAEQLADIDNPNGGLGQTLSNLLIADRNEAAMKVLEKEMKKGTKKIAIFYGAAHMPDFEKRLRDELDLVPVSTQWLQAWDLRLRERTLEEMLFKLLRDGLQ